MFQKLRQALRSSSSQPELEAKASNSSTSQLTIAVPRRTPNRDWLDRAKAGLKKHLGLARRKGRKSPRRVVDGKALAWQELANMTAAREEEEQESERVVSPNEREPAAEVILNRLASVDEARECWWNHLDDPCYHWPDAALPHSRRHPPLPPRSTAITPR
ncbi:hypothetical protein MMC07_006749 [Pseudocyphellaria aurata]|nr:hypothetical protein [Pseudocyphellaria aurata]